jgi:hypothetical protein
VTAPALPGSSGTPARASARAWALSPNASCSGVGPMKRTPAAAQAREVGALAQEAVAGVEASAPCWRAMASRRAPSR